MTGYRYPYYNSGYGSNYPAYTYDNSVYAAASGSGSISRHRRAGRDRLHVAPE